MQEKYNVKSVDYSQFNEVCDGSQSSQIWGNWIHEDIWPLI